MILASRSPGRKPSFSPASTAGRASTIFLIFPTPQRRDRHGHGQIRLPRPGRSDAEDEFIIVQGLEVTRLPLGPGADDAVPLADLVRVGCFGVAAALALLDDLGNVGG